MALRVVRSLGEAVLVCLVLLGAARAAPAAPAIHTVQGLALYGEPKYGPNFKHLDYVDPAAPKGGTVRFASVGTYDSFNPFSPRGVSAINIQNITLLYDRLMEPSFDELQSQYGMVAESVTYPDDYAWAEYKLRPNARWHDGTPITAEDVVFSFEAQRDKGSPAFAFSVQDVAKAEVIGPRTVRFTFKQKNNRHSLVALGLLTIVPKHYWQGRDFSAPVVTPPLTSGAYKITSFDLGHSITMERVPNYWGKDVPMNVGRFNFGKIIYEFYRDPTVAFEGFKAGDTDIRFETSQKLWATAYNFPAFTHHQVVRDVIAQQSGFRREAYYFNLRRAKLKDPVLREALGYAFDFTWMNKNLFYNSLVRSENYFGYPGTALAAKGLPTAGELALLNPYRKELPSRVFTQPVHVPDTDGTQEGLRNNLRIAAKLLADAGYKMKDGKLRYPNSDQPVEFEVLMGDPGYERATNQWAVDLKLLGITVTTRLVDLAQFIEREHKFDYDVIVTFRPAPPLPGPELRNAWELFAADVPSSPSWVGVKNPVVDALVEKIISAKTMNEILTSVHALDRVLTWNFYSLPLYSVGGKTWVAYWDRFGRPKPESPFGWPWLNTWWIDSHKDAVLRSTVGAPAN